MKDLKLFEVNSLYKRVIKDTLRDSKTHGGNLLEWLNYKQEHDLVSGAVARLTYHNKIGKFYKRYKSEIYEFLIEYLSDTGKTIGALFDDRWDGRDPLAFNSSNQGLLVWFVYERITKVLSGYIAEEKHETPVLIEKIGVLV